MKRHNSSALSIAKRGLGVGLAALRVNAGAKQLEKCIRSEATKLSCVPRLRIVERKGEEEKF